MTIVKTEKPKRDEQRIGDMKKFFRSVRRIRRRLQVSITRWGRKNDLPGLMRIYAFLLLLVNGFSGFWILALLYVQLVDRKQEILKIFPAGLNDAAALIPLTIAAFAALLFNAQQSVPGGSKRNIWFGQAARRLMASFYFFGSSFIVGVGSRIMDQNTFNNWRAGWVFNLIAEASPGMAFIEAMLAAALLLAGLKYYIRTMFSRD